MCWKSYANGSNIVALRLGDQATKEMLGVVDWNVWPVSNFAQQHLTTCNRVCKRTQHVTSNNVGSCWPTMLRPFARVMEDKRTWDCVKTPSKQLLRRTLLLRTIFCSALGLYRRPPPRPSTSPSNVVAEKSTHFHPFCSKFNFVWGGRGGVTSFSNITGKVPTLLTSIVAKVEDKKL